jgi:DNA-binding response OmpR family regulator
LDASLRPPVGESLRLLLQSDGHDVHYAQDGEVAIEIARDFKPQLVLLDLEHA